MKYRLNLFFLLLLLHFSSCKKESSDSFSEAIAADSSDDATARKKLLYSNTIFYTRSTSVNYFINPVRKPQVTGYFKAIPLGLVYDSITGRININKSETGLKYEMYYLTTAGNLVDSTQLTISGIDYADGIYEFSKGKTKAFPIYAANLSLPLPCDDDDDFEEDDDDGCEFDERDLNDDGTNDIPGANSLGFRVNRKTAVISLATTLTAGALGTNPQNGASGNFLFYYRLSDASNKALQNITVRLYYYHSKADIPDSLINELNARKAQAKDVNNQPGGFNAVDALAGSAAATKVEPRPKRPPLIILVAPPTQTVNKN